MSKMYECWLPSESEGLAGYERFFRKICTKLKGEIIDSAVGEIARVSEKLNGRAPEVMNERPDDLCGIVLDTDSSLGEGAYRLSVDDNTAAITGGDECGVLYGVFRFLILASGGYSPDAITAEEKPAYSLRMTDQWDNADGSIERGYAGKSIFYKDGKFLHDKKRLTDYARLLSSVGINALCINNVNAHKNETRFITDDYLDDVAATAEIFAAYGIKLYLSINFAAPIEVGGLATADPLDEGVKKWWADTAGNIYAHIPGFGGFLVKADSENRPGPFTYGRDHADGANMLGEALEPFGGKVIWRCFVYNCHVDWRDRSTDRARAAYDNFMPLDGKFRSNVYLQIKNGPMDFQIREAVSPLFGGLEHTNMLAEFQITQEYTGQQKDLCYLVPMWKECLDHDTYRNGKGSLISGRVVGAAGVSNIGDDLCWTGDPLAGANLYGFGRLIFDPSLSAEAIALEWVRAAVTSDEAISAMIVDMLMRSRDIYEKYTSPLGIGWMVTPHYHYGVDVDGYEYSQWGTYHYSDREGLGVDRTIATGTGYTSQYAPENRDMYENTDTCPDDLLLFFHHVPYTHLLHSGKTVIQHIYDTHFEGAEEAAKLLESWKTLEGRIDEGYYRTVLGRFEMQLANAERWRDVVNTYYYRKSGIADEHGRTIYP